MPTLPARPGSPAPMRSSPNPPPAGRSFYVAPPRPDISPGLGSRRGLLRRPAEGLARSPAGTGRTRAGTPTRLRRPRAEPSLRDGLRSPWTARLPRQAWPGVEAGGGARTRRSCSGGPLLVERRPGAGGGRSSSDESGSGPVDRAAFRPAGAVRLRGRRRRRGGTGGRWLPQRRPGGERSAHPRRLSAEHPAAHRQAVRAADPQTSSTLDVRPREAAMGRAPRLTQQKRPNLTVPEIRPFLACADSAKGIIRRWGR